ncbi:MAG: FecR family protein [Deltaproteobacteria bacterium]|nr:FecR family protein [Deltaproteobacteria bacterium]
MSSTFFRAALYGLVAFCCIICVPNVSFAAELGTAAGAGSGEVGLVLSLNPGVMAERDGQSVALEQKSPVNGTDVLTTDATGRAQILFADDSSVSLGSNTTLVLEDVVAEGNNPVFKARLGQGMARFITGKIVAQNPDGFSVVTPEATVGIRGTIFAVSTADGQTTVYVMNTTRQVLVNGITIPSGYKITLPDGSPMIMTPADMEAVGDSVAVGNDPAQNDGASSDNNLASVGDNSVFNPDTLEQPELGKQLIADSLTPPNTPVNPPTGSVLITGTLTNTSFTAAAPGGTGVGSFSFIADLGSGDIHTATMSNYHSAIGQDPDGGNGVGLPVSYDLYGGTGTINGNSFTVSGFDGSSDYRGMADYAFADSGGTASMTGTSNQNGNIVDMGGNYQINFSGGYYTASGTFDGSGDLAAQ